MLPGPTLPGSLVAPRPCFTAPSFRTFCGLAAGLAGQPRRRTVVGMLLGAGLSRAWPHDRAHYFFARARWEIDEHQQQLLPAQHQRYGLGCWDTGLLAHPQRRGRRGRDLRLVLRGAPAPPARPRRRTGPPSAGL